MSLSIQDTRIHLTKSNKFDLLKPKNTIIEYSFNFSILIEIKSKSKIKINK